MKRETQSSATETIRALGTTRIRRLTAPREVEMRVRMLLALASRQLERGDTDSARATLSALQPEDFGRRARRAEGPVTILGTRPIGTNDVRLVLRTLEQLLPPI